MFGCWCHLCLDSISNATIPPCAWQTVGSHGLGIVADIIEYNGNIYIVGDIDEIGGVVMNHVAMWDGISKKLRFLLCASSF